MILSIILGVTIDTHTWITYLQESEADHIVGVDCDCVREKGPDEEHFISLTT